MEDYHFLLERILFQTTGKELNVQHLEMQSGGCINMSVKAVTDQGHYFVKWNELSFEDMFKKEAKGLQVLRETGAISVPEVLGIGQVEEKAFMVQEFLERAVGTLEDHQQLGERMARLHQVKATQHGFEEANFIGKLYQKNESHENWVTFFIENRLNVQLGLAIYNQEVNTSFVEEMKAFFQKLPELIPDSSPSLLHGDLWNGNVMFTKKGPAIFDPAVYFGAREMDIAMTKLFGGFDQAFYEAYEDNYPLSSDFEELVDVYNLYPLMVHVNLFGAHAGYLNKVKQIINRYL